MQEKSSGGVLRFGSFEVNLNSGELRRNGFKIRLQDQPLQVLTLLLEQPGEVVTREALRTKLWAADTFVDFDHSLNAAVKRLRDALGDSAENPRFIETLARRGYRFIAPVSGAPSPTAGGALAAGFSTAKTAVRPFHFASCVSQHAGKIAIVLALVAIGTSAGWHAALRLTQTHIVEQRLTGNAADDPVLAAALSPDSKYLAFADRSGVFLRVVATGETHAITLPDGLRASARPSAWFPDGSHVLVSSGPDSMKLDSDEKPGLWSVSVLGGPPRKLVDDARSGAISPDGSRIAFVRENPAMQEIWLTSLRTGASQRISSRSGDELAATSHDDRYRRLVGEPGDVFGPPAWAPDGRKFAFTRYVYHSGYRDGNVSLQICYPDEGRLDLALSDRRLGESVAWSADGRLIYSLAEPPPNQRDSNLWVQPLDARTGKLVGEAKRLTSGPDVKIDLTYSPSTKRLAFLRSSGEPHVYIAQIEHGPERLGPPRLLSLGEGRNLPFTWTPDSASIVFTSDREGASHLFKQGLNQPAPDLLADGPASLTGPRLSPDGAQILFLMLPEAGGSARGVRLMRLPLSGGPPEIVLEEENVENLQCARLPSRLCLFSRNEPQAIRFFRFNPATGAKSELTQFSRSSELKFNWTLSADGSLLALAPWRRGQTPAEIEIFSLATGQKRTVTLNGWPQISSIDWAADSRNIWVSAFDASGMRSLLLVDLQGRARPMLQDAQKEIGWAIPAPDGKKVALWEASGSSNVWLLQGF